MTGQLWYFSSPNAHDALVKPQALPASEPPRARRHEWTLKFGRREVCVARREVLVDGALRPLQPRPFDVLVYLIENRERVVSTDELLDSIWKDEIVQPGSLAAAIMRVRKALLDNEPGTGSIIRTHQRFGYRFVAALDTPEPGAGSAAS
jgi:DNA-binding winged helix-turn-helix (wHTH) protein